MYRSLKVQRQGRGSCGHHALSARRGSVVGCGLRHREALLLAEDGTSSPRGGEKEREREREKKREQGKNQVRH